MYAFMDARSDFPHKGLPEHQLDQARIAVQDWAITHGVLLRAPATHDDKGDLNGPVVPALTVLPSPIERDLFNQAIGLQVPFNRLYAAVASDETWIRTVLHDVIETDEFVKNIWQTHLASKNGWPQTASLGLFRSDYMVNAPDQSLDSHSRAELKQVEFNTIASSFGGLSVDVAEMHRRLTAPTGVVPMNNGEVPANESAANLGAAITAAHNFYVEQKRPNKGANGTCVLFVCQPGERNVMDQRKLEYHVTASVLRVDMPDLPTRLSIGNDGTLLVKTGKNQNMTVSVVYWRAGYSPGEYSFDSAWGVRETIERSTAIKCPDALTQLAGTKKVQQALAIPGNLDLSRFLGSEAAAEDVRRTFVSILPLDESPAGQEAIALALDPIRSEEYVLKPQREGGGNNIYRRNMVDFLADLSVEDRKSYILMQLIEPAEQRNIIVRGPELYSGPVINELGVFGVCLWTRATGGGIDEIVLNKQAGHLVRTKPANSDEGGVAAGFGALDSCTLVSRPPRPSQA